MTCISTFGEFHQIKTCYTAALGPHHATLLRPSKKLTESAHSCAVNTDPIRRIGKDTMYNWNRLAVLIGALGGTLSNTAIAAVIQVPSGQPTIQAGIDAAATGEILNVNVPWNPPFHVDFEAGTRSADFAHPRVAIGCILVEGRADTTTTCG